MKILHLVTLASSDGAFGGPLRVALNQAAELARRGHDVQIAAGWQGTEPPPTAIDGIPAKLFAAFRLIRPMGFSGMVSPGLTWWLARSIADYDMVHVHAGRDLISTTSLAIARARRRQYVTQTHGMIQPDHRLRARIMDAIAMRRLLTGAEQRFVLTREEEEGLHEVLGTSVSCERLLNGVPELSSRSPLREGRREVLFCARLHPRKRPVAFVQVAAELARRGVNASFALIGPDEGELGAVRDTIAKEGVAELVQYEGALDYSVVIDRMTQADVYVLPSVNEPFPMSLLEALSVGLPSVCTDSCDISAELREHRAAVVTDGSVEAMADAVEAILSDDFLRAELASNAVRAVRRVFSMDVVGTQLERCYGVHNIAA
jgi:glycosyltransferase involved in cell wall biosynthesis